MPSGAVLFNDRRLARRFRQLQFFLESGGSSIINQISPGYAERKAMYRFLRNESVSVNEMLGSYGAGMPDLVSGKDILAISDSSEISLKAQLPHLKDPETVGVLSDNRTPGYFIHATMALDAQSETGLCLSDLLLWNRPKKKPVKQSKKKAAKTSPELTPEQKESYKWRLGIEQSERLFEQAARVTYLFDREADIFSLFATVKGMGAVRELIVRAQYNRKVLTPDGAKSLAEHMDTIAFSHSYTLKVQTQKRRNTSKRKNNNRQGREASIRLRHCPITLLPPQNSPASSPLQLWVVEALEAPESVPPGEEPIHWRIVTTHCIQDDDQAMQIIRWYELRWMIEQLFRLVKMKGFAIEVCELQYASSITKLTAMVVHAAFKVMVLMLARDKPEQSDIAEVFSIDQQKCLAILNKKLQGKTAKLSNPYRPTQLAWAAWIIARIGGWKGLISQGLPGPITMIRGIIKFDTYFEAWNIFNDERDVGNS